MTTFLKISTAALLTLATAQIASAAERAKVRADRTQAPQSQQFRDSNAYYAPDVRGQRDTGYGTNSRLEALSEGGAISPPAGR